MGIVSRYWAERTLKFYLEIDRLNLKIENESNLDEKIKIAKEIFLLYYQDLHNKKETIEWISDFLVKTFEIKINDKNIILIQKTNNFEHNINFFDYIIHQICMGYLPNYSLKKIKEKTKNKHYIKINDIERNKNMIN